MISPLGPYAVVVTAEHGGNDVPPPFQDRFRGQEALLASHRGWDPGTLTLAGDLAGRLAAPLVAATVTRLLVDLNRSPWHPRVFSEVTRGFDRAEREVLLQTHHTPHRTTVESRIAEAAATGAPVLHLGIHSFTPALNGKVRRPDVALLYDPARPLERGLAARWVRAMARRAPERVLGRNDPYRGSSDGLTTTLRGRFAPASYLGIEIEVNQRHLTGDGTFPSWVGDLLVETLAEAGSQA